MPISTFLITGATQGIGRATALKLVNEQCKVYAVGRNPELLSSLNKESAYIQTITADITTVHGRNNISQALAQEPAFSIIHSAGIVSSNPFTTMNETVLRQHFETNFFAPLLLTQKLLPQLQGQKVLNISSAAAVGYLADKLSYCTSKGAMHHAMLYLDKEFMKEPIYFANLFPGMVDTGMQEKLRQENLPSSTAYKEAQAQGKLISPALVADFIAWVMLKTDNATFSGKTWDIYDAKLKKQWLPKGITLPSS